MTGSLNINYEILTSSVNFPQLLLELNHPFINLHFATWLGYLSCDCTSALLCIPQHLPRTSIHPSDFLSLLRSPTYSLLHSDKSISLFFIKPITVTHLPSVQKDYPIPVNGSDHDAIRSGTPGRVREAWFDIGALVIALHVWIPQEVAALFLGSRTRGHNHT